MFRPISIDFTIGSSVVVTSIVGVLFLILTLFQAREITNNDSMLGKITAVIRIPLYLGFSSLLFYMAVTGK